jgi:outer membrane protein OmpA-like peptidoglycan-associated protein
LSRHRKKIEEEDESFFISMTDIMVGLLFIFILIIVYFAIQSQVEAKKYEDLVSNDEKRRDIDLYNTGVLKQRDNLLRWLSEYLSEEGYDLDESDFSNGILRLPEGVLFDSGKFIIKPNSPSEKAVKVLASAFSEILPCSVMTSDGLPFKPNSYCNNAKYGNNYSAFVNSIFIEGHTDNIPVTRTLFNAPSIDSNLKLSAMRSANTIAAMSKNRPSIDNFYGPIDSSGKTFDQLKKYQTVIAGSAYGKTRPIVDNKTRTTRAKNRRIDIRILMYEAKTTDSMNFMKKLGVTPGGNNADQRASTF